MKPNIVMIISHDSGQLFEPYGYGVATPALDKLADEGVLFDQYFATAPQCSPSRSSILTGCYPHTNGLMGLAHLGFAIDSRFTTLPKALHDFGYTSTLIGLSHETIGTPPPVEDRVFTSGTALGYDQYIPTPGDRTPDVVAAAATFLAKQSPSQPFYLNLGLFETHLPYDEYAAKGDDPSGVQVPLGLPDDAVVRTEVSHYTGAAHVLDEGVGAVYDLLEQHGLLENTIVIFTNDHGAPFPGHKGTLRRTGLATSLIVRLPERPDLAGKREHALLSNTDLLPTLLDLVQAPAVPGIAGRSFAASFDSATAAPDGHDFVFGELTWHDAYHPMRSIRSKDYSFVKNFADGPATYMPVDIHLTGPGAEMREQFYVPNAPEELYDLATDPLEQHNLVANPAYAKVYHDLRHRLHQWLLETHDPILTRTVAGTPSKRWANEIAAGRAYQSREAYASAHHVAVAPFTTDWGND
ncbi:sulfatase family protein [Lacticaseibacillus suihuaensis]